ncbi:MAG TPA: ABC transporter permease [Candidatus Limnocylindrales bacterium]|nr:ABC transporter permease [Candidatus Limnocylindrales bacterium]
MPLFPLLILAALIFSAAFADIIAPHDPLKVELTNALQPPVYHEGGSMDHILGTDELGRDILSRLMFGGRVSILLALSVILLGMAVGVPLGLISGYIGGVTDAVIQRLVEAVLSLPTIMVALVCVFVLGQTYASIVLILSPFVAAEIARMVRGEALAIRRTNYTALARVAGASHLRIIARHILPNVAGTIIVVATLQVGALILVEASLSFLGVGVPPPTPAWGLMIDGGREYVATKYWLSLFPGLAIVLTVLSINWIGDWLQLLLDPKQQTL